MPFLITRTALLVGLLRAFSISAMDAHAQRYPYERVQKKEAGFAYPQPDLLKVSPALGERTTSEAFSAIYTETYGPSTGARLLTDLAGDSTMRRYEGAEGTILSRFQNGPANTSGEHVYCTHKTMKYGVFGSGGTCLIDKTGDGTFDVTGLFDETVHSYHGVEDGTLSPPVPYEVIELTEDQREFEVDMMLVYQNLRSLYPIFSTFGKRTKPDVKSGDLNKVVPREHRVPPGKDRQAYADGIEFIMHEADDDSITYTITGGTFDQVSFLHPLRGYMVLVKPRPMPE